ncbi:MAG: SRPBCC family protein [Dehalococcoidia bacterium]|nr:SRPBCC family protein [Thermoflexaceae bacterium]
MSRSALLRLLAIAFGAAAAAHAYVRLFTPWQRNWGATQEESEGPLEGDEFVDTSQGQTTRAITVDAPPECIWPWLVQMGYRRGGFYSWDFLDRLFRILDAPSSKRVLPEFQQLAPGDEVPVGVGPAFPVLRVEPARVLVLGSADPNFKVSWQTVLRPLPGGRTRLITRNRVQPPPGLGNRIGAMVIDIAAFVMVRRWLKVLKERGEGLATGRYE